MCKFILAFIVCLIVSFASVVDSFKGNSNSVFRFSSCNVRACKIPVSKLHAIIADESISAKYEQVKLKAMSLITPKVTEGKIPSHFVKIIDEFLDDYSASNIEAHIDPDTFQFNVLTMLKNVQESMDNPLKFEAFHKAVREPFDFYTWGNNFFKPLVIFEESKVFGIEIAHQIKDIVAKGENVVILSNHQTEVDPQVISILLEKGGLPDLADKIIFIAGHKVTTDPMAVPFSVGRNLICIHSKKHIKNPPEEMPAKQAQNLESMKVMTNLLTEGGKIIWVAPSGGRDRPDPASPSGEFAVSPFDYKALDMFKLIAMQSKKPMHLFPMAMYSHKLIPPPSTVSSSLGESRSAKRGAVSIAFLPETDGLGGLKDKEFAQDIQDRVEAAYKNLVDWHNSHQVAA